MIEIEIQHLWQRSNPVGHRHGAPLRPGEELYNSKEYRLRVKFRENAEVPFLPRICLIWNTCWQGFLKGEPWLQIRQAALFLLEDQTSSDT